MDNIEALRYRIAPLEMTESEFRLSIMALPCINLGSNASDNEQLLSGLS